MRLPAIEVRWEGYRFPPDGSGIVGLQSRALWTFDIVTRNRRQLTWFETVDMTPDGKQVLFDRSPENADVLIDLPK
jgi:hypothetical protein